MKAILFHHHGGPEVLEYTETPTPEPGAGDVLIRLRAAALNRLDIWTRDGWPGIKLGLPHILGADGAGEVAALGPGATAFSVGDRVAINPDLSDGTCEACIAGQDNLCVNWKLLGEHVRGTYAEYIAVPERNLLRLPDSVSFETAAAAALVYLTAWHSLITRGGLTAGETVLIVGAGGGVNTASIQIAALAGARVYVVGSNAEKCERALALGAHAAIDRSKDDWAKAIFQLTGRRGVDVVVDNVGAGTMASSQRAARKGGRILTVGNTGGAKFEFDNRYMFGKHLSLIGSTMGTRADFAKVMGLVFGGHLRPVIDTRLPLEQAREAHARLQRGEQFGKIVLTV